MLAHKLTFFALLIAFGATAQSNVLLKAEGEIPQDFITSSTIKYKKEIETLDEDKIKRKEKKQKQQFLLESNFAVDDILQSGLVLFNDPASDYVNAVLENLPYRKHFADEKIRVYVLKSSAVNAFATNQGIIFVTLGLLANLQNEAELAFILAHELEHVEEEHAINKYIFSKDIQGDKNARRANAGNVGVNPIIFKESMYSQQLEDEADEGGLELFLESEYSPTAILDIFKVLHYSYLPFDEIAFKKSFFEDENYVFPAKIWQASISKIRPMTSKNDKNTTHPSSVSRLTNLKKRLEGKVEMDKKAFILPEQQFADIQAMARYQMPFFNLFDNNYAEALYTAYLLLQESPDDVQLQKVVGKSLYMEAKFRDEDSEAANDYNLEVGSNTEGQMQQVYHLFNEISDKDMVVLALKYNWNLHQKDTTDLELKMLVKDLFVLLADDYESLGNFSTTARPEEKKVENAEIVSKDADEEDAEVTKLKRKQLESVQLNTRTKLEKIDESTKKAEFSTYAFVEELKNPAFASYFTEGQANLEKQQQNQSYYETTEGTKAWKKRQRKERKKGKQLGIDKIVVINPFYLSVDVRKKDNAMKYIRTEEQQNNFRGALSSVAEISKIEATILDVTNLQESEVAAFNDIAVINQYFEQQMNHFDWSLTPGYQQNAVNAIADKYDTDYFLWTGAISMRQKSGKWGKLFISLGVPPLLPFLVMETIRPEYDMLYFAILFDVKTGKRSIIKMDYFDSKDSKTLLNTHIYDVFEQISNE